METNAGRRRHHEGSVERLGLAERRSVVAIVMATDVMIGIAPV